MNHHSDPALMDAPPKTLHWLSDFPLSKAVLRGAEISGAAAAAIQTHLGLNFDPDVAATASLGALSEDVAPLSMGFAANDPHPDLLMIEALCGIGPLVAAANSTARPAVPDALQEWVFGGDAHSYLLMDASAVPMFDGPDSADGLECLSLYQSESADSLASVAPYIVALKPDHSFTRRLFTQSAHPVDLWDAAPGIIIRSKASIDVLRKSLRKFTKLNDARGKAYFLRFYDPDWSLAIQLAFSSDEGRRFFEEIESTICVDPVAQVALRSTYQPSAMPSRPEPLKLRPEMREALGLRTLELSRRKTLAFCIDTLPDFDGIPPNQYDHFSRQAMHAARRVGLHIEQAVTAAVAAAWVVGDTEGKWFAAQPDIVGRGDLSQAAKGRALLDRAFQIRR